MAQSKRINQKIASTIGTPPYGISKYLVDIIQPTLKKNHHKVKNSRSFVSQAPTWKSEPDEIQVSYDVTNLYPSIPIDKAIDVIIQQLSEDYENLKTRARLTLVDIQQLIELYVSDCYFLWDNVIWNLLNSGLIGLSILVVLSESYLQYLEKNAIELALTFDIASKTFRRYVDDSHARFGSRNNAAKFLNVLNSQDPQIQYTIEYENDHKELNFLDVTIRNNLNQSYDFAVYRKPAITNVQIKPHSNIFPNIAMGVLKGFLS